MTQTGAKAVQRGAFSWFFQRVTAVLLAYFLGMHIIILHFIRKGTLTFSSVTERIGQHPGFYRIFYYVFIPSLVFHMMNGAWSVFLDYNPNVHARKFMAVFLWATGLALSAFGMAAATVLIRG